MTHDLRVERVYDAAPGVVFDAFTDPEAQQEMYADEPDWIVRSACDLRVGGRWGYLYRAIDGCGQVVDVLLREHRYLESAGAFFTQAMARRDGDWEKPGETRARGADRRHRC